MCEIPGIFGILTDAKVGKLGELDFEGEGLAVHRIGLRLDHLLHFVGFFGGAELDECLRTCMMLEKENLQNGVDFVADLLNKRSKAERRRPFQIL